MINQSRRTLLKGIGYGITAVAAGISSSTAMAAFSKSALDTKASASALSTCDITIYQQQTSGKEIVSLMNLTDQPITLDKITPVGLEHVNDSLIVKVNKVSDGVVIEAGERLSFGIEAISAKLISDSSPVPNVLAGHLQIQSDHPSFNGIIPVTVFDSQVV